MSDRFWLPDRQDYAVLQERQRHTEALYQFGEYTMFVVLWRIQDHTAGHVDRCPRCFIAYGKTAEVYQQPAQNDCPECFGTTFEGGYKARLVRPALWDDTKDDHSPNHARGEVIRSMATIQTTDDFYLRTNDYAFRGDGTRWQVKAGAEVALQTGFHPSSPASAVVGYTFANAAREDESSVAFSIPPTTEEVQAILSPQHPHYPQDFAEFEVVRGPLVPVGTPEV